MPGKDVFCEIKFIKKNSEKEKAVVQTMSTWIKGVEKQNVASSPVKKKNVEDFIKKCIDTMDDDKWDEFVVDKNHHDTEVNAAMQSKKRKLADDAEVDNIDTEVLSSESMLSINSISPSNFNENNTDLTSQYLNDKNESNDDQRTNKVSRLELSDQFSDEQESGVTLRPKRKHKADLQDEPMPKWVHKLMEGITELKLEVRSLSKDFALGACTHNCKDATISSGPYKVIDPDYDFPVTTIEQLEQLNNTIENNPMYLGELRRYLSTFLEKNRHRAVWKMLSKFITDDLGLQYSMYGHSSGKPNALEPTKLWKIIEETALNPPEYTLDKIKNAGGKWLRGRLSHKNNMIEKEKKKQIQAQEKSKDQINKSNRAE